MRTGGTLGPPDSLHQDTSIYNQTCLDARTGEMTASGCYTGCVDPFSPLLG